MHCCIINVKIPSDMSPLYGKRTVMGIVYPVLDEFGYVLPEEDLQQKLNSRYSECNKTIRVSILLSEEEAVKTACIRAEWKPLETTAPLDRRERKALKRLKKRGSDSSCHICLEKCKSPTTMNCEHTFCYKCIKKWLGIKRSCPVCSKKIEINVSKCKRKRQQKTRGRSPLSR